MKWYGLTRCLILTLAAVLTTSASAQTAASAPAEAAAAEDTGPPTVRVLALTGSPTVRPSSGGETRPAEPRADLAFGDTVITGDSDRLAIAFGRSRQTKPGQTDLLIIGPKSRVRIVAPTPEEAVAGPGKDALPIIAVADVERGIYHAVVRDPKRHGAFAIRAGGRDAYFDGSDALGSYEGDGDLASYIALTGTVEMHAPSKRDASRKRRVKIRAGMVRTIAGGKIAGARALGKNDRETIIDLTRIPSIDTSQPPSLARDDSVKPPSSITNPLDWQYDPVTNRHFDPGHGHWHEGRPPKGKVAANPEKKTERRLFDDKQFNVVLDAAENQDAAESQEEGPFEYVRMSTTKGDIVLRLDAGKAPISVANFLAYTKRGFYDGTIFHRVIANFMIQGGGFTADLEQKSDTAGGIKNEWENGLKNVKGTIAMARLGRQPDSATSQFFINVQDNSSLDQPRDGAGYAVFGRVVEGMEVVEAIRQVPTQRQTRHANVPIEPVIIEKVEIIAWDAQAAEVPPE